MNFGEIVLKILFKVEVGIEREKGGSQISQGSALVPRLTNLTFKLAEIFVLVLKSHPCF